ncbi:MAG: hydrogenase expression/formation C-terminal domain-containing protein [Acidiphilium sp.]|nr:hydrogenase expression/formation C-terminal domain-containing protein [Acidiphilium sp.]MDD4935099.1 hydrogenase expression/formation C-terminal domain-containing protein [Acidiphilium sp.]
MSAFIPARPGPGSFGDGPDYLPLPKDVTVFVAPDLPDDPELRRIGPAWLGRIGDALAAYRDDGPAQSIDLTGLTATERRFLDEVLGHGEVTALVLGNPAIRIEETIFTGLWRIRSEAGEGMPAIDRLEIGPIPAILTARAAAAAGSLDLPDAVTLPEFLVNAPHILAELIARSATFAATGAGHMINLDLVPMGNEELTWLAGAIGEGPVVILSAGYGACRIRSTRLTATWWVQYSNASDALILNSLEIAAIPAVACAAADDIAESALRVRAVAALYP